jgi:hypothetical protein
VIIRVERREGVGFVLPAADCNAFTDVVSPVKVSNAMAADLPSADLA